MRNAVASMILPGAMAVLGALTWHASKQPPSTREQPPADPYGLYYRLTVDLSDKHGRPVGIDIVVGCGVHRGRIIGGGSSVDVMAMDPIFYAWAIPDGHALSVRTSPAIAATDTCTGDTTDTGRIAKDWLPFVIWYEDATDLSHGLAYATQDAYASPKARLSFQAARIAKATADEYRAFKARGPANLLPPYLSDALLRSDRPQRMRSVLDVTPAMIADPKRAWRNSGWLTCRGVMRIPIPEVVRTDLAKLRPLGAAKYWHLDSQLPRAISDKIPSKDVTYGGGFMRPDTPAWREKRPQVYPQSYDRNLDRLTPRTFADGAYRKDVTINPAELGFMFCGRAAPEPLEAAVTGRQMQSPDISMETCFIDGILIGELHHCFTYSPLAFEDTAFVIRKYDLSD